MNKINREYGGKASGSILGIAVEISVLSILLLAGLSLVSISSAIPVEEWNKTFGGLYDVEAYSVQQTSDEGYIIAGKKVPDAWLIKTDENGNQSWEKTFDWNTARSVRQTSDGGYILAGYIGNYVDAWLIKTDSNGIEQWNKTFGGTDYDYASSVQQTSDGGYILAGDTFTSGGGPRNTWLVKTDSNGIEQWNKTFGGTNLNSVQQTSDGGYILAGNSDGAWLIKTDSNGIEQWNKIFSRTALSSASSVQQTSDGGYILVGYTGDYGWKDAWLIKTDSNGIEQWNKTFGGTDYDYASSVQQTSDGGYILAGDTFWGGGWYIGWLIKTDSNGIEQWNKTLDARFQNYDDTVDAEVHHVPKNSVQQTSDGGYIVTGDVKPYNGRADARLIKFSDLTLATPPTVYITANPDTNNINVSTNFTFTANPVGSWGSNIQYSWSIGYEKCVTTAVVVFTGQSISPYVDAGCGNATITVAAEDEKNNTANDTYLVTVHKTAVQTPLTINITLPANNSYSEEFVNFSGTANGGTPPYTYTWTSDKNGTLSTTITTNTSNEFSKNLTIGTHNISLTVQDSVGNKGTKTITLNVVEQVISVLILPTNFADTTAENIPRSKMINIGNQVSRYYLSTSYNRIYFDFNVSDKITLSKDKSYYDPVFSNGDGSFRFDWNDIPGKGDGKLVEFLKNGYGIEWAEKAKIEKIDDDKIIRVSNGEKSLLIRLYDNKTKANLAINDGRIYELYVKTENDKLSIYNRDRRTVILDDVQQQINFTPTKIYAIDLNIPNYVIPRAWTAPRSLIINSENSYGDWAHEIGHAGLNLVDLYQHGRVWWWDLMDKGNEVEPPTNLSSFNKLLLNWLTPNPVSYGEYKLKPLEKSSYGEKVYFFKRPTFFFSNKELSYIIEPRDLPLNHQITTTWLGLPNDGKLENGVVIYKVENIDLFSIRTDDEYPHGDWKINSITPSIIITDLFRWDDPTLFKVDTSKYEYVDPFRYVKFTISSVKNDPYYQPTVKIEPPPIEQISKKIGFILKNIKINIPKLSNPFPISSGNITSPDLDLHAYTPDRKHVGMNYSSGEYEMQIPGAVASGDLINGEEWIFFPNGTQISYYIDSHDVQKFLEENPGVDPANATVNYTTVSMEYGENPQIAQLPDGNWTVTNRTISEPKEDTIEPGITKEIIPTATPTPTLKGDLNNNGIPADAGDLVLMKRASIGEIPADSRYDLNNNGIPADAGDLVLMKRASIGEINLTGRI